MFSRSLFPACHPTINSMSFIDMLIWPIAKLIGNGSCCSSAHLMDGAEEVAHVLGLIRKGTNQAAAMAEVAQEFQVTVAELSSYLADPKVRSEAEKIVPFC